MDLDLLFDDDVLGDSGDFGLLLADLDAPGDDWLCFPSLFPSPLPQASVSVPSDDVQPVDPPSGLLALPLSSLVLVCSFLEWPDMQSVLRAGKRNRLRTAISEALGDICSNTWRLLEAPVATFDVRVRSSMMSSVDRLKQGEVSARVHNADLRILMASRNVEGMEPAMKMARMSSGLNSIDGKDKEFAVARLISIMYQSLEAAAQNASLMVAQIEAAQVADSCGISEIISKKIDSLALLCKAALRAISQYRKKIPLPAAHVCALRTFQELIFLNQTHLQVLQRGWKYASISPKSQQEELNDSEHFPAALVFTKQEFGAVLRPGQIQLFLSTKLLLAPSLPIQSISAKCTLLCAPCNDEDFEENLEILANFENALDSDSLVSFKGLKFTKPSRQKLVHLVAQIKVNKTLVLSSPCFPILVYSHQKQLVATYETLLRHYLFKSGQKVRITFPQFVNTLQEFFASQILSNRAEKLVAGFTGSDLSYIRSKFFQNNHFIRADSVDEFFKFLGPFLYSLSLHKDYVSLWQQGYLAGFVARERLDLRSYGPGEILHSSFWQINQMFTTFLSF